MKMGKLLNFLFILSVLLTAVYSLANRNDTRSATAEKRDFGILSALLGRQGSVLVTDTVYSYIKDKIFSRGTIKIVVWNKSKVPEISNAKWTAVDAEIEAPLIRAIESQKEPAVMVAHFSRRINQDANRIPTVWISYGSSAILKICICAKIELSESKMRTVTSFGYNVYQSRRNGVCQSPPKFFMVNENDGYRTIIDRFKAECALASYDMGYVLNVYIMTYPLDQAIQVNPVRVETDEKAIQVSPVESAEKGTQNNNQEHQTIQVTFYILGFAFKGHILWPQAACASYIMTSYGAANSHEFFTITTSIQTVCKNYKLSGIHAK